VASIARHPGAVVGDEVSAALAEGRPVVALESAIITHCLPRPASHDVATELENLLRRRGVTPATVAVIDGVPTVGLTRLQLDRLAEADAPHKASLRDLPVAMAGGVMAGTTVAATAWLASRAGIAVFATGGIGGVHRGATTSFDESADLVVLARTPITVICAGVKSVLDIAATLERLETLGIVVVGYQTSTFPGFYVTDSGFPVPARVNDPTDVVAVMHAAARIQLPGALIVANPVPAADQLDPALHEAVIRDAVTEATRAGIMGPAMTPYLLDRLQRATDGASLAANLAAVRHNVRVAAEIALAWSPFPPVGP
jgi:pseudouridine-5'-phosphate glycosidase